MPRLRLIEREIAGQIHRLDLWYDTKNKAFSVKGLPQRLIELTGFSNHGLTEAALETALNQAITRFHEAIQTETEILLVSFKVGRASRSHKSWRDEWGNKWEDDPDFPEKFRERWGDEGHGFHLTFERFTKLEGESTRFYAWSKDTAGEWHQHKHYTSKHNMNGGIEMPYTAERFEFFEKVAKLLKSQALKIALFLSQDADEIVKFIEGRMPLTLGAEMIGQSGTMQTQPEHDRPI